MEPSEETLVTLDGSASMDPDDGVASHLWTQVDGDPVSLADPTSAVTTFTAPKSDQHGKNLKFKLTVKDFGGLQSTADSFIYVKPKDFSNNPPTAIFNNYDLSKKEVKFIDQSNDIDGTIESWLWDFGDGKTSTEQNPEHRYTKFGVYSVTLTVTDNDEASQSISQDINVSH